MKRAMSVFAMMLSIALLSGCSCWPFSEQLETEFEWTPRTFQARLSNPDVAQQQCFNTGYADCVKTTAQLCRDKQYSSIRHPITGAPVNPGLAQAVCAEAENQIARNSDGDIGTIWLCRPRVPEGIKACMEEKGYEGVNVTKKTCGVKIM